MTYSAEFFAKKLGPLVPVHGVALHGEVWEVHQNDLTPMAFSYRADAVQAFEDGDTEKYKKLESIADKLYETAEIYGVPHYRVPRLNETDAVSAKPTKDCEQCGEPFEYRRKSARFCSKSCQQKHSYYQEAA